MCVHIAVNMVYKIIINTTNVKNMHRCSLSPICSTLTRIPKIVSVVCATQFIQSYSLQNQMGSSKLYGDLVQKVNLYIINWLNSSLFLDRKWDS